jgi:hypothetical protein
VLTVLDFIGQQHREFRFDLRFRALTGIGRGHLARQVSDGFTALPAGSQIVLDRVVQEIVLANVRQQLGLSNKQLIADVRSHASQSNSSPYQLQDYLSDSGRDIKEIYRRTNWTSLKREAGLSFVNPSSVSEFESAALKRMNAFVHIDDSERARAYSMLSQEGGTEYSSLSDRDRTYARMLISAVWPNGGGFGGYEEALKALRMSQSVGLELAEIAAISSDSSRAVPKNLGDYYSDVPLFSHATYRREEILAALGWADITKGRHSSNMQSGVQWCDETRTDALFVTLHKSERMFLPSTMYKDYALNEVLFHWESQNATSGKSNVGQRYINHVSEGSKVLLFTRHANTDDEGIIGAYRCLGLVDYVSHVGEKPMGITWRLDRPMPSEVYLSASAVAR